MSLACLNGALSEAVSSFPRSALIGMGIVSYLFMVSFFVIVHLVSFLD